MHLRRLENLLLASVALICFACPRASGADYEVTASGRLGAVQSEAKAFDGTTTAALPDILDLGRLQGGSFRATYRFMQVTPATSGTAAHYDLGLGYGMTRYELLDANGVVVHRGTNPSEADVVIENNFGSPPFSVDQVFLSSVVNSVTGVEVPEAKYSLTPDFLSAADISVVGNVGNGVNYLNELSIPTDEATYLSFPNTPTGKSFDVLLEFGDGDYLNQAGPYQHVFAQLRYDVSTLAVMPVPEPTLAGLLAICACGMLRRSHRQV